MKERILVVDDDRVLAEHLRAGLSREGYEVVAVNSGTLAVEAVKKAYFHVVIVDLMLPDIQGIEVMRLVSKKYDNVCFILSSGFATVSSAIEALKVGAYDYIIKPFDLEHLKLVVRRGIEKQGLEKSNRELLERVEKEKRKLEIIMDAYTRMSGIYRLDDLADFVTEKAVEIVEAERSSLMMVDDATNELVLKGSRGLNKDKVSWRVRIGETVSGWVAKEGQALLVKDIESDERLQMFSRKGSYKSKSFISLPLKIDVHVIGVINVTDKLSRTEIFTEADMRYLSLLAHQTVAQIENIKLCETLGSLAVTDSLTTVFNHRYFQEQITVEIMRSQRYKHPLAVMMFDVDNFKTYNDGYGHLEGDRILKHVAWVMRENLRQVDILCRYGGDEFVVILPFTESRGAQIVAEKIRRAVERMELLVDEKTRKRIPVTVSCGVASFEHNTGKNELLSAVDGALYQAKKDGRNCVRVHKKK